MDGVWTFDLSQYEAVWAAIIQLLLLFTFLLIGNALRRTIPFLKKSYIPSALIGGGLLFLANYIFKKFGIVIVNQRLMQIFTYHALAIGFIASSLKIAKKDNKSTFKDALQNGAITGGTYMLQAIIGIIASIIFFAIGTSMFYDAGILLPLGFGQGPGNALIWDLNFTAMDTNNFNGQGSVGLTIASIGFIVSSVVGILYINFFKRKGEITHKDSVYNRKVTDFETDNEIEDSESVDKFSIQFSQVALCYGISFLIMVFFANLSKWTGVQLFNSVAWGFNFLWGVISAIIVKTIIQLLEKKQVIKRRYINNYQMDRISGLAFDLMIIAGVAAIDTQTVGNYLWFIAIISDLGALATTIYVRLMSKLCFKKYQHESFLVNFGTLTGTASNGMILLREIDPNYETPINDIFIFSQLPAMIFVAPLLLLLNMSATSFKNCIISLSIFTALFIGYTVFLVCSGKKSKNK